MIPLRTIRYLTVSILAGMLLSTATFASDISLQGRSVTYSCGYFSEMRGDYQVTYQNDSLPWGSRVILVYGQNGSINQYVNGQPTQTPVEWQNRAQTEAQSVAPFTWQAQVSLELAVRSEPYSYGPLAFVFQILLPNGQSYFDNGGQSTWGYYLGAAPVTGVCEGGQSGASSMAALNVSVFNRN